MKVLLESRIQISILPRCSRTSRQVSNYLGNIFPPSSLPETSDMI